MAYEVEEAKELVIKAGKKLVKKGLIARTWGNVSARISDTQFVITPSGRDYQTLTPEDIVVVNMNDLSYEGDVTPSSEKGVHAKCYLLRPEVNFVIHTHQSNASALSVIGRNIIPGRIATEKERKLLGPKIPCAHYGRFGTSQLADHVADVLEQNPECNQLLMRYHGVLCLGESDKAAFKVAENLEKLSGRIFEHYTRRKMPEITDAEDELLFRDDVGELLAIHARTPFIMKLSHSGRSMRSYLDDLAMVAGTVVRCVPEYGSNELIMKTKAGCDCVLLEKDGALCFGKNEDEALAVAMVLEKGAQAAYLAHFAKNAKPLSPVDAMLDRTAYLQKYAKLKDQEETGSTASQPIDGEIIKNALNPEYFKEAMDPQYFKNAVDPKYFQEMKDNFPAEQIKESLSPEHIKENLNPEHIKENFQPDTLRDAFLGNEIVKNSILKVDFLKNLLDADENDAEDNSEIFEEDNIEDPDELFNTEEMKIYAELAK